MFNCLHSIFNVPEVYAQISAARIAFAFTILHIKNQEINTQNFHTQNFLRIPFLHSLEKIRIRKILKFFLFLFQNLQKINKISRIF